jgi:ATP-binding cassette, subfamily B, bacterial PglK
MKDHFTLVRKAFELLDDGRRWRWWYVGISSLVLAGLEAAGAGLVYLLVAIITTPDASLSLPVVGDLAALFPDRTSREIKIGAALFTGVFFLGRAGVLIVHNYVLNRIVNNAQALIAGEMLDGYLSMPYLFHTQRNSARLIRNTYQGTTKMVSGIIMPVITMLTQVLLAASLLTTMFVIAPQAMLIATVGLTTVVIVIQRGVKPRLTELGAQVEEASAESIGAIQQSLGGVRDIKLLEQEDAFTRQHLLARLTIAAAGTRSAILGQLSPLAIETSIILSLVAVFVFATSGDGSPARTLATLAAFAYVGQRLGPIVSSFVGFFNGLTKHRALVDIVNDDISLIRDWRSLVAHESEDDHRGRRFEREVRLETVHFAYGSDAPEVLHGVDLTVRRGEFVGICGPTGGGKSTMLDVLVGLLQPTSGRVLVDGIPLGPMPRWWWEQLGVVSQAVFLTDDTVRGNIAFGVEPDDVDQDRLERCVRRAQLDDVVLSLPHGLDTFVGERGVKLSGGQRQRVAIARALYREPEVLILDEGTSALDGATERALVAAIDEATHERTLIAIAHRISTIRDADRIIVVADGRIQDVGTHDELLARNDLFRALA